MTLEQVARRARVSPATVSRVLNHKAAISSAARARVMKVIQELKFSPNLDARGLAAGSRSIGVIVSNFENPFFVDVYKAVEAGAGIAGFDITMANTGYSPERLTASVRLMIGRRVAGLAAIVSQMDPGLIEELHAYQIPTVFYDVGAPGSNIVNIRVNYRPGSGSTNYPSGCGTSRSTRRDSSGSARCRTRLRSRKQSAWTRHWKSGRTPRRSRFTRRQW
jgi:DNA-binding LacI/PurR family transcriptional regulator